MNDERLDLSPLDPTTDTLRWARLVRAINTRAAPELAMRAAGGAGLLNELGRWAWPALAAAALVGAISGAALRSATTGPFEPVSLLTGTVIEAFDVSGPVAQWLAEGRSPTVQDIVLALEEDGR